MWLIQVSLQDAAQSYRPGKFLKLEFLGLKKKKKKNAAGLIVDIYSQKCDSALMHF